MRKARKHGNYKDHKVRLSQRPPRAIGVKSHVNPNDLMVQRACQGKRQYLTKQRAGAAVSGAEKHTGLAHRWHHCSFCGYFHICRKKDEEGNEIKLNSRDLIPKVVKLEKNANA